MSRPGVLRFRLLPIAFAVLACSGSSTGPDATPPTPPPPPALYALQGVTQDSLAGKPAAAVVVQLGSFTATTDFLGAYQIGSVPAGNYTLAVNAPGFEPFSKALTLTASTIQNIPLRRTRPFLTSFSTANNASILIANVVDLQGASTINLAGSSVFYSYPGGGTLTPLSFASASLSDPITLHLQFNAPKSNISQATWTFNDMDGNHSVFLCLAGGSCNEQ